MVMPSLFGGHGAVPFALLVYNADRSPYVFAGTSCRRQPGYAQRLRTQAEGGSRGRVRPAAPRLPPRLCPRRVLRRPGPRRPHPGRRPPRSRPRHRGSAASCGPSAPVPRSASSPAAADSARPDLGDSIAQIGTIKDLDSLLERVLFEARRFANADAGTIYMLAGNYLYFSYVQNDTLFRQESATDKYVYSLTRLPGEQEVAGRVRGGDRRAAHHRRCLRHQERRDVHVQRLLRPQDELPHTIDHGRAPRRS